MRESSLAVFCDPEIEKNEVWVRLQNTLGTPVTFLNRLEDLIHYCVYERPSVLILDLGVNGVKSLKPLPRLLREELDLEVLCFSSVIGAEALQDLAKQPGNIILGGVLELKGLIEKVSPLISVREKEEITVSPHEGQELEKSLLNSLGYGFGSVKLQDLDQILKDKRKKRALQMEAERRHRQEQLLNACGESLLRTYASNPMDGSIDFTVKEVHTFIVELVNFRGILCLGHHQPTLKAKERTPKFGSILTAVFDELGVKSEVTGPLVVKTGRVDFVSSFSKFSDFLVHHRKEESQFSIAFIKRESTRPSRQVTADQQMLKIDIKSVPPLTTIPFDCFLYLPKNQKYVRYIKSGSQITLDQVKRHSKNPSQSHLYIPIDQELELMTFSVQQTLDWELTLEKHKDPKAS